MRCVLAWTRSSAQSLTHVSCVLAWTRWSVRSQACAALILRRPHRRHCKRLLELRSRLPRPTQIVHQHPRVRPSQNTSPNRLRRSRNRLPKSPNPILHRRRRPLRRARCRRNLLHPRRSPLQHRRPRGRARCRRSLLHPHRGLHQRPTRHGDRLPLHGRECPRLDGSGWLVGRQGPQNRAGLQLLFPVAARGC